MERDSYRWSVVYAIANTNYHSPTQCIYRALIVVNKHVNLPNTDKN